MPLKKSQGNTNAERFFSVYPIIFMVNPLLILSVILFEMGDPNNYLAGNTSLSAMPLKIK
jgi:hypothetical protein